MNNRILTVAASAIVIWMVFYVLIVGQSFLIPIVIAIFIWNMLNMLGRGIHHLPIVGRWLPGWFCMILSLLLVLAFLLVVMQVIGNNVNEVVEASSRYQQNLKQLFAHVNKSDWLVLTSKFERIFSEINLQGILLGVYGMFTSLASSAILIALYVVFLFVEQHVGKEKLSLLFPQTSHRQLIKSMIQQIGHDVQAYLGIKSLMGLITAIASWGIMTWIGLDFAEFWALLIFFLNYIPNIGAIVATAFPALLALIQFQSWIPCAVMTTGLIVIQFIIGNLIEPRYLGRSLNLSPLVILFALGLWGQIWGVLGMFLSVPITVILMIIFAHFDSTRPAAILLSQTGRVKSLS